KCLKGGEAQFRIEECLRLVQAFSSRFQAAVVDNKRRREQEKQAEERRRRREREEAARAQQRRRHGSSGAGGSESECSHLVDSFLYDIRSGLMGKDLKVRKLKRQGALETNVHNGGGITSEEETGGSPQVTRRRIGSFSGVEAAPGLAAIAASSNNNKEDNSQDMVTDVTPNGTLRRRRSRVPSEEDESGLMDFLRYSGHDGSRERKSWAGTIADGYGSLDRSWARRARGGMAGSVRRRPDLLGADFSGDRERTTSPSRIVESQSAASTPTATLPSTTSASEETSIKPGRPWKQKIEAWLQENEREEKAMRERSSNLSFRSGDRSNTSVEEPPEKLSAEVEVDEEGKRQLRRRQRLSTPIQGTLETKPSDNKPFSDGKDALGMASKKGILSPGVAAPGQYRRVYQDWKPSVEKTDLVGTMEAIEEVNSGSSGQDKSAWRKSSLNVPNSSEETINSVGGNGAYVGAILGSTSTRRRIRTNRSSLDTAPVSLGQPLLQAIKEEDKRKGVISTLGRQQSEDKLTLYIRKDTDEDVDGKAAKEPSADQQHRDIMQKTNTTTSGVSKVLIGKGGEMSVEDNEKNTEDVDAENVETPPALRKVRCSDSTAASRRLHKPSDRVVAEDDEEEMGDGQFERFSAARRTRRYKRISEGGEEADGDGEGSSRRQGTESHKENSAELQKKEENRIDFGIERRGSGVDRSLRRRGERGRSHIEPSLVAEAAKKASAKGDGISRVKVGDAVVEIPPPVSKMNLQGANVTDSGKELTKPTTANGSANRVETKRSVMKSSPASVGSLVERVRNAGSVLKSRKTEVDQGPGRIPTRSASMRVTGRGGGSVERTPSRGSLRSNSRNSLVSVGLVKNSNTAPVKRSGFGFGGISSSASSKKPPITTNGVSSSRQKLGSGLVPNTPVRKEQVTRRGSGASSVASSGIISRSFRISSRDSQVPSRLPSPTSAPSSRVGLSFMRPTAASSAKDSIVKDSVSSGARTPGPRTAPAAIERVK
ncbi:hypothetical protein J437_LFUL008465, partial [Ladona fulva]